MTMEELFTVACQAIDQEAEALQKLSHEIWSQPELLFEEKIAHDVLTKFLTVRGFTVEKHYTGVDTAFKATWKCFGKQDSIPRSANVAFICEYDALPEIGHACGHNLIAQLGVAAGLGVKAAMEKCGQPIGQVTIFGTPAEEGGGGKIDLINAGAFEDVDVAMMCHPAPFNLSKPQGLAIQLVNVTFHGKASHAAACPWEGVNALDAAVQTYNSISVMRQQMKPTSRIHGVIQQGGAKANIIPDLTKMEYIIRAPDLKELKSLVAKADACFKGAAAVTGCKVEFDWSPKVYSDIISNSVLVETYDRHIKALEPERVDHKDSNFLGSTDMGNVSYVVPSIHPFYTIGTSINHTKEFTEVAGSSHAQPLTQNQGKALAMTAIEIMSDFSLLERIQKEFKESCAESKN